MLRKQPWTQFTIGLIVLCLGLSSATADEVDDAVGSDPDLQSAAIVRLRSQGPAGLDRLLERVRQVEQQQAASPGDAQWAEVIAAFDRAIEQVGGARYCRQSGLFWYADLEQAKAAARAQGKPILALRMLGNLTDEFSCANSRFFRTTLYANAEISRYLHDHFILTWRSVRPVPKVTIDFGDGRKLERTLTGNSIHYILTPDGVVVDALPGLYGPAAFLEQVQRAEQLANHLAAQPWEQQSAILARSHHFAMARIAEQWELDLAAASAVAQQPSPGAAVSPAGTEPPAGPPTARAAGARARAKADVEMPVLAALQVQFAGYEQQTSDEIWDRIAALHAADAQLDEASRRVVAAQRPNAAAAGRIAITKRIVEDPLLRLVRNLQKSISLDTVKNEYTLHRKVHAWLSQSPQLARDVEALNERVYSELFLTPSSDPWLGLAPPDVYTALPNGGIVTTKSGG